MGKEMKIKTSITILLSIAFVFSVGIAIVNREWTMDAFYPLIGAGFIVLLIGVIEVFIKWWEK
jgi:hypothetical protein